MNQPLCNKRVLVTRASGQNTKLSEQLANYGAIPVEFPTIAILPANNPAPLDQAIARIKDYQWLIFTSQNGVNHFWQRWVMAGKKADDLQHLSIIAIGPATAKTLKIYSLQVDLMPENHIAEAVVEMMGDIANQKVLLPTADIARDTIVTGLQQKGAIVERVTAYHTQPATDPGNLLAILPTLDALTFTSGSTVRNFVNLLPATTSPTNLIKDAIVACIGPVTAQTAQEMGLTVSVMAETYTTQGLVEALITYYSNPK